MDVSIALKVACQDKPRVVGRRDLLNPMTMESMSRTNDAETRALSGATGALISHRAR